MAVYRDFGRPQGDRFARATLEIAKSIVGALAVNRSPCRVVVSKLWVRTDQAEHSGIHADDGDRQRRNFTSFGASHLVAQRTKRVGVTRSLPSDAKLSCGETVEFLESEVDEAAPPAWDKVKVGGHWLKEIERRHIDPSPPGLTPTSGSNDKPHAAT
jgi:hypothetical protein